jgi:Asp-tRNA(Asn)/Glu-tRNA(Gln) amidotransferase A subunit family amidase
MIKTLINSYQNRELTVEQSVRSFLNLIDENSDFNAILHLNVSAINDAIELDQYLNKYGKLKGRLHGIPVILKANMETNDQQPTSCGSVLLKDFVSNKNAAIVTLLLEEGAIILGKANMSEFSNYVSNYSESGFSSLGGQTISAYGSTYPVGGSSSGSAVAVATSLCIFSIGSETDGSVVYPAAHNGVFAIKFAADVLSSNGIIGISSYFDSIGYFTKNIEDLSYLINFHRLIPNCKRLVKKIFIQEDTFAFSKLFLEKIQHLLYESEIEVKSGTFINEMAPYFEMMDIICQTEFKINIPNKLPFSSDEFLEKCRGNLLGKYHPDINEIERSFASNFLVSGKYKWAKEEIEKLRNEKLFFMKKNGIDVILAITLGSEDVASIASLIGLSHLVIPISFGEDLPISLSIIGLPKEEEMMVDLANKILNEFN